MKKLNKKGVTHADWAISMGIFIIYVSFLIIFILPSLLKTTFDPSILFSSFENNFLKPIEWSIAKVPINVVNLKNMVQEAGGNSENVRLRVSIIDDDHIFTRVVPGEDNILLTYDLEGNPTDVDGELPNTLSFSDDSKKEMIIGCSGIDCNDKILYYFSAPISTRELPKITSECSTDDETACKVFLGIEEEMKGIKETKLLNGVNEVPSFSEYKNAESSGFQGYNLMKTETLKFPDNKDFDILYQEDMNNDGILENNRVSLFDQAIFSGERKPPGVPDNANVFIKEYKRFYLDSIGNLKTVIFYFEVW